ncbi:N-acetyltransferase family protein [Streptococcus sp. E29BA]|uniref:GNAT family N-acetyltransferase n=1 Tax=Streptococcus sp. E29BA TaxID=3278716 RepID=UPI00359CDB59
MGMVSLRLANERDKKAILSLIAQFWLVHNQEQVADEVLLTHYQTWTGQGHLFYLVSYGSELIGFAHLGARGGAIDWLEDFFIRPDYQGRGFGRQVMRLLEEKVRAYSASLYIEVAARNLAAIDLYTSLGYDCLNTLTIRKDFQPEVFDTVQTAFIAGHEFVIRRYKDTRRDDN